MTDRQQQAVAEAIRAADHDLYEAGISTDHALVLATSAIVASDAKYVKGLVERLNSAYGCICHFQHVANPDRQLIDMEIAELKAFIA